MGPPRALLGQFARDAQQGATARVKRQVAPPRPASWRPNSEGADVAAPPKEGSPAAREPRPDREKVPPSARSGGAETGSRSPPSAQTPNGSVHPVGWHPRRPNGPVRPLRTAPPFMRHAPLTVRPPFGDPTTPLPRRYSRPETRAHTHKSHARSGVDQSRDETDRPRCYSATARERTKRTPPTPPL